jgi:hypothetical protein
LAGNPGLQCRKGCPNQARAMQDWAAAGHIDPQTACSLCVSNASYDWHRGPTIIVPTSVRHIPGNFGIGGLSFGISFHFRSNSRKCVDLSRNLVYWIDSVSVYSSLDGQITEYGHMKKVGPSYKRSLCLENQICSAACVRPCA